MNRDRLLVFTKPPVPGRVKTRLIGPLSADDACRLHVAMVEDLVSEVRDRRYALELVWDLEPGEEPPTGDVYDGLDWSRQLGQDLGQRMWRALASGLRSGDRVVLVGSDVPGLDAHRIERAFALLASRAQVVIGPAGDGGYYLIGFRREALDERLFRDVPWSTEEVLPTTLERIERIGVSCELLERLADVDEPRDLERLRAAIGRDDVRAPRTAAVLDSFHPAVIGS